MIRHLWKANARQAPPGQAPPGQAPPGQAPPRQAPPGQAPPGQAPPGQAPPGQAPSGKEPVQEPVEEPVEEGKEKLKPMELNMGKSVVEKLEDISKKQSTDLVVPPQEKLKQLSKVVNNDKMLDIIRGKNFAEFTEKEIKDVDIVRSRFNSFVNDYYQLLDMFYTYKKNKEKGEKEDVSILLKQEKQIEQLKNIVLEYKTIWRN